MLYHCYRKQIMLFNQRYDLELDLPCKQLLSIEREAMEFDREWLQRSSYTSLIHQKIWRYWNTAQYFGSAAAIPDTFVSKLWRSVWPQCSAEKITHTGSRPHYPTLAGTFSGTVPTGAHERFRLTQGDLQENGFYRAIFRDLQTVGFGKLSLGAAPWRGTGFRLEPLSRR